MVCPLLTLFFYIYIQLFVEGNYMDNITFFNCLTLRLFEKLYSSFPTPIDISTKELAMSVIPEHENFDATWNGLQLADDAVDFLALEGFLTHKGTFLEGGTFLQTRLTLKGLTILGSIPESLESRQTLIDRIRGVLPDMAKGASGEAVKQLTQLTFAMASSVAPTIMSAMHTFSR